MACAGVQGASQTLKVGATAVPHAEILNFIKPDLAVAGIKLEVIEFTDYVTPNIALAEKQAVNRPTRIFSSSGRVSPGIRGLSRSQRR